MPLAYRFSLVGNVVLVAVAVALFVHLPADRVTGITIPSTSRGASEAPAAKAPAATPRAGRAEAVPAVFARLEKAGVAKTVLADIVRADHRRRWGRRTVELENRYAPKQPPQREYLTLHRLEEEDETRALKQALGEEAYAAWDREETLRKLNFEEVPMNSAEEDRAYELDKRLDDKLRELRMAMEDGDADIADAGTLQLQAQEAYEKDLEKLLGTERYNKLKGIVLPVVDGHMEFNEVSPTPEQTTALRAAVSDYQAGEAELSKRLADKPADPVSIAAELKKLSDAQEASIRNTLGADTYAKLQRDHDDAYQTLTQFSQAWNLGDGEIEPVYDKVKAYIDNVDRLRRAAQLTELAGQTADWNTINTAIEQYRQKTEAELQNLIGPDRTKALERNDLLSPKGSDRNAPHGGG